MLIIYWYFSKYMSCTPWGIPHTALFSFQIWLLLHSHPPILIIILQVAVLCAGFAMETWCLSLLSTESWPISRAIWSCFCKTILWISSTFPWTGSYYELSLQTKSNSYFFLSSKLADPAKKKQTLSSAQPVDKPALGIGRKRVCRVNVEKIAEEV